MEMARVDNSTVKMQFEILDFSELVGDAALSFQPLYEEKGQTLHLYSYRCDCAADLDSFYERHCFGYPVNS